MRYLWPESAELEGKMSGNHLDCGCRNSISDLDISILCKRHMGKANEEHKNEAPLHFFRFAAISNFEVRVPIISAAVIFNIPDILICSVHHTCDLVILPVHS